MTLTPAVHRRWKTALLLIAAFGFAPPVQADTPPVYQLIAAKHGLSGEGLYQLALRASGRQSAYSQEPTPWPWTVRLCRDTQCETVYPDTREAMAILLTAGQQAGLTLYVGPLALRWNPAVLPLRAATQPRVTLNEAARQLSLALQAASPRATDPPASARPSQARSSHASTWAALIDRVSAEEKIPAALVHSIVAVESSYNPLAVSPKGAVGLMQLMPATAERFGLPRDARTDPERNLRTGARYLNWLLQYFNGDLTLAIAGYNAGEYRVTRYGWRVPPFRETQNYVQRVVAQLDRHTRGVSPP